MVQFAPAARLAPQEFAKTNEDASVPVRVMLVIDNAALPVFVRVTVWDALEVPRATVPNDKVVADNDAAGPTPVPVKAMLCGELVALSVMVMVAVRALGATGAKWPWMEQLDSEARLVGQLLANTNEEASAPATLMLEMVRAAPPKLVRVIDCDAVAEPTFSEPNDKLVADKDTAGPAGRSPVPLNAIVSGEPAPVYVRVMVALNAPTAVGAKWP
jgi:hypothetical protein